MDFIIQGIQFVLFLFMLTLFARMILGFVMAFSRDWRPTGPMLVLTEGVFTVTDPPLRAVRKVLPPLNLGGIRLDLAFLVVYFTCLILYNILGTL